MRQASVMEAQPPFEALEERLESELYFSEGTIPIQVSAVPVVITTSDRDSLFSCTERLLSRVQEPSFQEPLLENVPDFLRRAFPNITVGAFDYHLTPQGPKLIEYMVLPPGMVSFYARFTQLYNEHLNSPFPTVDVAHFEEALVNSFAFTKGDSVVITDVNPRSQITHPEILYFQALLKERGIGAEIQDARDLRLVNGTKVYSRVTLHDWEADPRKGLAPLTDAYKRAQFSPEPSLWFLGDKRGLILLCKEFPDIVPHTAYATDLPSLSGFIVKPPSSYGGKGVDMHPTTAPPGSIAQAYVQAPTTASGNMNYDIRVFVLNGKPQLCCARTYIGEKTNRDHPGTGFAPVFVV
ncbi:MAG: hypothetical protein OXR66_01490 [Candidatus Woesearchaeota archaeon]|nr:hypothetical protein [Candidatus Woesearchaeota archaeon]